MTAIELEDVTFLFVISLLHAFQLAMNASRIGSFRRKYKISPPEMNGPPDFLRAVRCQQNDLEFAIPFQLLLWTSGICCNQVAAAAVGALYLYARRNYTKGYIEDPEKRLKPFHLSINAIKLMLVLSIAGLVNCLGNQYFGLNLGAIVRKQVYRVAGFKDEL